MFIVIVIINFFDYSGHGTGTYVSIVTIQAPGKYKYLLTF